MRRAAVRVTRAEALPEGLASPPEESVVAAASERLDALVAAAFRLSRAESARLFEAEQMCIRDRRSTWWLCQDLFLQTKPC